MPTYFAYGSNMNVAHLRDYLEAHEVTLPASVAPRRAILRHHRMRTNYHSIIHQAGACNLEPCADGTVEGVVYDLSDAAWKVLCFKEGCPQRYRAIDVEVDCNDRSLRACTFVVTDARRLDHDQPVTAAYRARVLEAAHALGLSAAYLAQLENVVCA